MARIKPAKLSKRELDRISRELRYMAPENIAEDFSDERSRAAIAAVFEWLSLNSTAAWRLKNGTFTDIALSKSVRREPVTSTHLILTDEAYERAYKLLVAPKKRGR